MVNEEAVKVVMQIHKEFKEWADMLIGGYEDYLASSLTTREGKEIAREKIALLHQVEWNHERIVKEITGQ